MKQTEQCKDLNSLAPFGERQKVTGFGSLQELVDYQIQELTRAIDAQINNERRLKDLNERAIWKKN